MQKSGLAFNLLIFVQFSTLKNGGRASSHFYLSFSILVIHLQVSKPLIMKGN